MRSEKKKGRVSIVGVGLIGGSLGLALKKRGIADEVVGVCRRRSSLKKALAQGAVDWGTLSARRGLKGAKLVVLGVPAGLIVEKGVELADALEKDAVLTDAGSVKGEVVRELDCRLPKGVVFVGGHPVAGSEKRGVEAASGHLYEGSICVLTPGRKSTPEGVRLVTRMWKGVGCRVVKLSPSRHDVLLGQVSHLPHVVALGFGGGGFGDSTRIANGDPGLWADILLANRAEICKATDKMLNELRRFRGALVRGNRDEVVRLLEKAKSKRELCELRRKSVSKGRS